MSHERVHAEQRKRRDTRAVGRGLRARARQLELDALLLLSSPPHHLYKTVSTSPPSHALLVQPPRQARADQCCPFSALLAPRLSLRPPRTFSLLSLSTPSLRQITMGFPEFTSPAGLQALEAHLVHVSYIEGSVFSPSTASSSPPLSPRPLATALSHLKDEHYALVRVSEEGT